MSRYFDETMLNAERHYERVDHNCTAKMINGSGFTAHIDTTDRTYFVSTKIDKNTEIVIMEISPAIHCSEEARSQVSEYINKINIAYKCGNIHIDSNGNIYIRTEQRFDDAPLSAEMFGIMEGACIMILDTFELILEKLAHMKLLTPDEADVEKVIENRIKKRLKMSEEKFSLDNDDDDDDNDDDDDDDDDLFEHYDEDDEIDIGRIRFPEPPGFTEWLRKKVANSALKNETDEEDDDDDDDDKKEDKESHAEDSSQTLFEKLTSISDDNDDEKEDEDKEAGTTVIDDDE